MAYDDCNSSWRPRFGRYFSGPWPHEPDVGVGIALAGMPTDESQFVSQLMGVSCNPAAARRILDELKAGQVKKTTVMAALNFERIGDMLADIGVSMTIIEPAEPANQEIDLAVLCWVRDNDPPVPDRFTAEELKVISERTKQMRRSLQELPLEYGPYAAS